MSAQLPAAPTIVPTVPMTSPCNMKIRRMLAAELPIVLRIGMSRVFSITSSTSHAIASVNVLSNLQSNRRSLHSSHHSSHNSRTAAHHPQLVIRPRSIDLNGRIYCVDSRWLRCSTSAVESSAGSIARGIARRLVSELVSIARLTVAVFDELGAAVGLAATSRGTEPGGVT